MVELRQLSGGADLVSAIRSFPFCVGRQGADLNIMAPGVWDRHLLIQKAADHRYHVVPQAPATVVLRGNVLKASTPLQNGDVLELGSVRLQFRISSTRPRSLWAMEITAWTGLAILAAIQALLMASW